MKRKPLPKSIRFEVFKRDSFTCQYCGRSAPDVILECDHIVPVAEGGKDEPINLITSCRDCNRGKGKKFLSDTESIKRQKKQLDDLNEIREQTEMMVEWKRELLKIREKEIDFVESIIFSVWRTSTDRRGPKLKDAGRHYIGSLIEDFGLDEVKISVSIAIGKYFDDTKESLECAIGKIGGICYNRKRARLENRNG